MLGAEQTLIIRAFYGTVRYRGVENFYDTVRHRKVRYKTIEKSYGTIRYGSGPYRIVLTRPIEGSPYDLYGVSRYRTVRRETVRHKI